MTRTWRTVLLASLVLNCFFVGALVNGLFKQSQPQPQLLFSPRQLEERVTTPLVEPDRRIMRQAFDARRAEIAAAQAEFRNAMGQAIVLVDREPIDLAALRRPVEVAKQARSRVSDLLVDAILDGLGQVSRDGRRALLGLAKSRPPECGSGPGAPPCPRSN